jgi:hypothetical protein
MEIWINGVDVSKPSFSVKPSLGDIFRSGNTSIDPDPVRPQLLCVNCGERITRYGPETFHTESTLIRCDVPGNDGEIVRRASC